MKRNKGFEKLAYKEKKYKGTVDKKLKEKVVVIDSFPELKVNGLVNWAKDVFKVRKETEPGYLEVRAIQGKFHVTFQVKEKLVQWCEVKLNS